MFCVQKWSAKLFEARAKVLFTVDEALHNSGNSALTVPWSGVEWVIEVWPGSALRSGGGG